LGKVAAGPFEPSKTQEPMGSYLVNLVELLAWKAEKCGRFDHKVFEDIVL